jgi:hypothetical protein
MIRRKLYLEEKNTICGVFSTVHWIPKKLMAKMQFRISFPDIEHIVMDKLIVGKLHQCLAQLTKEEQESDFCSVFSE